MVEVFGFCAIVCLFFLSHKLTEYLSQVIFILTKHYKFSIHALSVIFLPGVIIHELSHWVMANLLFVQTGDIEFFPQRQGDRVKLGSVEIAKTDFVRRFLIGIAPLLGGLGVLFLLYFFLSPTITPFTYTSVLFLFAVFEIGNTMFSSRKDMEGALGVGVFAVLILLALFFFKVPVLILLTDFFSLSPVQFVFWQVSIFCLIALALDALFIFLLRIFLRRKVRSQHNW